MLCGNQMLPKGLMKKQNPKQFDCCKCLWPNSSTYIHNWSLQPFSQDYVLAAHTAHVVCFNFIREWRDLQFNIYSELQIFEKLYHGRFIFFIIRFDALTGTRTRTRLDYADTLLTRLRHNNASVYLWCFIFCKEDVILLQGTLKNCWPALL